MYGGRGALHLTPYTLHPTPYTLHPTPCTIHPFRYLRFMALQRYFLELMYKGTGYSGFQVQKNAPNTVQEAIEKAFAILQKQVVTMTGSSRTDAGVHALQNFFHFEFEGNMNVHFKYKMNAILP